jgi:hypothetical protein
VVAAFQLHRHLNSRLLNLALIVEVEHGFIIAADRLGSPFHDLADKPDHDRQGVVGQLRPRQIEAMAKIAGTSSAPSGTAKPVDPHAATATAEPRPRP